MNDIKDYPIVELDVNEMKKDKSNPNVMTLEQMSGLEKSIVSFGRLKHIVVDQDNVLIDGEHRLEVEKSIGTQKVNVIQVPVKDEVERKIIRETLNKLHGQYDIQKESSELLAIFKSNRLEELKELLGKPNTDDFEMILAKYQGLNFLSKDGSNLFGVGSLTKKWGMPPFSVLDTTSNDWQKRKNTWFSIGLAGGQGREHVRLYNVKLGNTKLPSYSIFDPVLCELMYRWFTIPKTSFNEDNNYDDQVEEAIDNLIIDPFAGGTTRGIVAAFMGHTYVGIDLSYKQVEANYQQYDRIKKNLPENHVKPTWIQGDSFEIDTIFDEQISPKLGIKKNTFDMMLTCPPYFNFEQYTNDKRDLGRINNHLEYVRKYNTIIDKICDIYLRKKNSFAVWVTNNTRDWSNGTLTNITGLLPIFFEKNGFMYLNDIVVLKQIGTLPLRAGNNFRKYRYLGPRHENCHVYFRGKKDEIPKLKIPDSILNMPQPEPENGSSINTAEDKQ